MSLSFVAKEQISSEKKSKTNANSKTLIDENDCGCEQTHQNGTETGRSNGDSDSKSCGLQSTTNTALWVINHSGIPLQPSDLSTHREQSSSSPSKEHINSTKLKHSIGTSQSESHLRGTPATDLNGKETSARSKSIDLKNSTDDLSSVASTQTRLQLKRVRIFSLREFRSRPSMNSSNDSINSDDSGSISINSSFVSLPRPPFPTGIKSPVSSFAGSQRSLKSNLQPYTPHPAFNSLAELIGNGDNNNHLNKVAKTETVLKSASDSTLLNDSSDSSASSSTTEDEGITDVRSPVLSRSKQLPSIPPSPLNKSVSLQVTSTSSKEEIKTKKKSGRVKTRKTHPQVSTRPEVDQVNNVARDTNDFQSFPTSLKQIAESNKDEMPLSDESLFESTEDVHEETSLLTEVMDMFNRPKTKPASRGKSEPFPAGAAAGFSDVTLIASHSSPVISHSDLCSEAPAAEKQAEERVPKWKNKDADRKAIVEEIISSEYNYVKSLEQISQAVKKIKEDTVLDEDVAKTIFHNLRLDGSAVHHEILLDSLKRTVANNRWDPDKSTIGATMCKTFQSSSLHDNYLAYVRNCENSKELIKQYLSKNAAFSKFNEKFKLQSRNGHDLNHAVSIPANRLSSYQMFLQRYHDCTPPDHPDYVEVPKAIQIVKGLLDAVGKVDDRSRMTTLRDLEALLDVCELVAPDREFLRVDTVNIPGHNREFRLWMFSDLILITMNKLPRTLSNRKVSMVVHGQHGQDIVPGHRRCYKLHKRVGLDDTEVLNSPEAEIKKYADDMKTIETDLAILRDIQSKAGELSRSHEPLSAQLTEVIYRCEQNLHALKQRTDDTDLASLRLLMQTPDGADEYKMVFRDSKTRAVWEKDLLTAKLNLEAAIVNKLPPEFVQRIPVDKTRAGMQFTCATSSLAANTEKDVWFCNSDTSAGHLCRLSATSKPSLTDCVPIPGCNSRIACICSTPNHPDSVLHIYDSPASSSTFDTRQSLLWLGCDDGTIHIVSADTTAKSLKEEHIVINCIYPILSIAYIDGKVFVALNRRKILVFRRGHDGVWNLDAPHTIQLNTQGAISQLLPVSYKLWCSSGNEITIIDPMLEQPERSFKVNGDKTLSIQAMAYSRQGIVAVALKSSCDIKLIHHSTLKLLVDVNVFSTVAQKLSKCDEIIKQHKMACLKITSLVCCKHMLWIGTTAGVVLTLRLPKILSSNVSQQELDIPMLNISALDIGHTGNVRFLTFAELIADTSKDERRRSVSRQSLVSKMLVISGGDGYEVIDPTQQLKETVGFNDSINHLLVWKM